MGGMPCDVLLETAHGPPMAENTRRRSMRRHRQVADEGRLGRGERSNRTSGGSPGSEHLSAVRKA